MILPRIGLSRRRRLPVPKILENSYTPVKIIKAMYDFRSWKLVEHTDDTVSLEVGGQTVRLPQRHARMTITEWYPVWMRFYLPDFDLSGKTILDVGAGAGETALLYYLNGAKSVIAVEPDPVMVSLLRENAATNGWDIEVIQDSFSLAYLDRPFDFMKMDCEGCEGLLLGQPIPNVPCMIEVHTPQIMEGFSSPGGVSGRLQESSGVAHGPHPATMMGFFHLARSGRVQARVRASSTQVVLFFPVLFVKRDIYRAGPWNANIPQPSYARRSEVKQSIYPSITQKYHGETLALMRPFCSS